MEDTKAIEGTLLSVGGTELVNVGDVVFIRTVTTYHVGRVAAIDATFIKLEEASWVADTGRFSNALKTGTLNEVEPFPAGVLVAVASIVDVSPWAHALPTVAK